MEFLATYLPPEIDQWVFFGLMAASFVASFITVAFGIGGGALLLAIAASLLPPVALIPVHGVVQLGSNAVRMAMLRQFVVWRALPAFLIGAIIGSVIGGAVVVDLPPALVQLGVGCFILWLVVAKPPAWMRRWPILAGAISSFLTMFFGATGPFVASYTKTLKLDRHPHVATHAAFMTIQHALKVIVFGFLGFAYSPWLLTIVGLIAAGTLGTYVGKKLLNRLSNHNFHKVLNVLLVLIALRLIVAALIDMFG